MTKEISAKEAAKEYQKKVNSDNLNKLEQIYGIIRTECVNNSFAEVSGELINNRVVEKLNSLGYVVSPMSTVHDDETIYKIRWDNVTEF